MPSPMPRRRSRRSPPPPPPSDASPLPVPSPPPPALASPSAASSRATSPPPPAAASTTGRTPPLRCPQPPAEASTSRSPPLPSSPPPGAASTSHPPSLLCSPPPAAAPRATSPPLPSTTSRSPPLLSRPPPAAACTSRPPLLHDPTPSPSLHHQLQPPVPPRRTYTPINLPEGRYFDGDGELFTDKDGEGRSYSRPQPPRCEDTEQAVPIEALPPPNPFPPVSALMPTGLLIKYFLRVDADGFFHTYPHRGGPFKSLEEAQEAIDSYHANRIKIKYLGELSKEDKYVWHKLYWRDGTRKNSKEALDAMTNLDPTLEVVKCLLDKHNEDHHLLEELAYEVREVVSYKAHFPENDSQYECRSFSHLNVLAKRGSNDNENLLFIEITCTDGEFEEYALTCLCAVSSDDNDLCRVRVALRIRPKNADELAQGADFDTCVELQPECKKLMLKKDNWASESYQFDEIFDGNSSQKRISEVVAKPVVEEEED